MTTPLRFAFAGCALALFAPHSAACNDGASSARSNAFADDRSAVAHSTATPKQLGPGVEANAANQATPPPAASRTRDPTAPATSARAADQPAADQPSVNRANGSNADRFATDSAAASAPSAPTTPPDTTSAPRDVPPASDFEPTEFGPGGRLYVTSYRVSDTDTDKILVFDGSSGAYLDHIDVSPASDGARVYAQYMVFGPRGRLYVSTTNANQTYGAIRGYDVASKQFEEFIPTGRVADPETLIFGRTHPTTLAYGSGPEAIAH